MQSDEGRQNDEKTMSPVQKTVRPDRAFMRWLPTVVRQNANGAEEFNPKLRHYRGDSFYRRRRHRHNSAPLL